VRRRADLVDLVAAAVLALIARSNRKFFMRPNEAASGSADRW
jgi:hypothetical protein